MRGLSVRLKGKGLIYNWISNYRGLGVKSVKELDCGLVSRKVRGLIAKCLGKSITGQIIFLKKTLWTESTGPWTKGDGTSPCPMVDQLHTPSSASNPSGQRRTGAEACGDAATGESSEWCSDGRGSPRATDDRKRRSAKLMAALERHEESKNGLAMERSGLQC
jgi:hypothetical protein